MTLVRLFETITLPVTIYSVAYSEDRANEPLLADFRDCIFAGAAKEHALAAAPIVSTAQ